MSYVEIFMPDFFLDCLIRLAIDKAMNAAVASAGDVTLEEGLAQVMDQMDAGELNFPEDEDVLLGPFRHEMDE